MSDMNYGLKFNIDGADKISRVIELMKEMGINIDKTTEKYKTMYTKHGKAYKGSSAAFQVSSNDKDKLESFMNQALGSSKADRAKHNVALVENVKGMFKQQEAEINQKLKDIKAAEKALADRQKFIEQLIKGKADGDLHYKNMQKNWDKAMDAKFGPAERKAEQERLRLQRLKNDLIVKEADLVDRVASVHNKAADARSSAANKSVARQTEVNNLLMKATAAYDRYKAEHGKYAEAVKNGDEILIRIHSKRATKFLSESEKMVNSANRLANATEKVANSNKKVASTADGATKKQNDFFKIVNKTYGQVLSLNRLGHMAALAGGFYIARDAATAYYNAVKKSLQFNEEITRAETTFRSLAISDTGKSAEQIRRDGIAKEIEQLTKAEGIAANLTDRIRETAAYAGQDFGEAIGAVKVTLGDIMSKYKGKGNMFIEKPQEVEKFSQDLVEIASVLKMIDPQGRKMSFHAVALGEAFSGSLEGSKAFKANFMSLLRRENIKLTEQTMKDVTNAINKGDFIGAMEALKGGLAKSGVYAGILEDLKIKSIGASFDGIKSNLTKMFGDFNKPLALLLADWANKTNTWLTTISRNSSLKKWIRDLGVEQAAFAKKVIDSVIRIGHYFETDKGKQYLSNMKTLFNDILSVAMSLVGVVASFVAGLSGANDDIETSAKNTDNWHTSIQNLKNMIDQAKPGAEKLGVAINKVANALGIVLEKVTAISNNWLVKLAGKPLGAFVDLVGGVAGFVGTRLEDAERQGQIRDKLAVMEKRGKGDLNYVEPTRRSVHERDIVEHLSVISEYIRRQDTYGGVSIRIDEMNLQPKDLDSFLGDLTKKVTPAGRQGTGLGPLPNAPL